MVCGGPGVSAHGGEYIVHMNLHGVWFPILKRAFPSSYQQKCHTHPPNLPQYNGSHKPGGEVPHTPPHYVPGQLLQTLPAFKPLPQPTTQSPHSHKLPVSNASAAKARTTKDRVTTSSPHVSSEPEAREPQSTSVLVTSEAPVRKHKPRDPSRLTNGVEKLAFNRVEKAETNKVEKPMVNGIDKPLVNGHPEASPAPQSWPPSGSEIPVLLPQVAEPQPAQPPQASRNSDDQGRSTPEDPEMAVIVTSDTPNSSQIPAKGTRKESGIKKLLLRILSSCGWNFPKKGQ
ncbi:hypothetical protein BGX38DRAFT_1142991 [Terfezia claveryi]|nr:hypothetical protein BGX38DRAFT_1142991 [Terfezia claveryi]